MNSPSSRSLASLRICVLQLPALLRREANTPAGADAAANAALVLENKMLQMLRIEEALCRTLDLLKRRSPAESAFPFSHSFNDGLLLPTSIQRPPAAGAAAFLIKETRPSSAAAAPLMGRITPSSAAASSQQEPWEPVAASRSLAALAAAAAAASTAGSFDVRSCLKRLPAAGSAEAATPFDLLVLPEMWSSPYHSSCFAEYAEILPASADSSAVFGDSTPHNCVKQQLQHASTCSGGAAIAAERRTKPPGSERFFGNNKRTQEQLQSSTVEAAPAANGMQKTAPATAVEAAVAGDISPPSHTADAAASPAFAFMQALARRLQVFVVGGSLVEKQVSQQSQQQETAAAAAEQHKQQQAVGGGGDSAFAANKANQPYRLYNTCCVFDPSGGLISKYRKSHLFDVNILKEEDPCGKGMAFQESATLSAGNELGSFSLPFFGNVGVGICYDLRFPEYALALAQQRRCLLLCYPGAFNQTTGPPHWALLLRGRALDNQVFVIGCSPASPAATLTAAAAATTAGGGRAAHAGADAATGGAADADKAATDVLDAALAARAAAPAVSPAAAAERGAEGAAHAAVTPQQTASIAGEYPSYGHSMVVGPWGDVVAQLGRRPGVLVVTAAAQRVRLVRKQIPIYQQKRFRQLYTPVTEIPAAPVN